MVKITQLEHFVETSFDLDSKRRLAFEDDLWKYYLENKNSLGYRNNPNPPLILANTELIRKFESGGSYVLARANFYPNGDLLFRINDSRYGKYDTSKLKSIGEKYELKENGE